MRSKTVQRLMEEMENEPWHVKLKRWLRLQRWVLMCRTRWIWDLNYEHNIFKKKIIMQDLFLKPIHVEILNMLVTGVSRVKIAAKLSIKVSTVNSYLRDMNRENECNVYQLIWMYAQASKKYTIKNI